MVCCVRCGPPPTPPVSLLTSSPERCFKWRPLELTPKIRDSHIAPRSNYVQVDGVDGIHCGAGQRLTILHTMQRTNGWINGRWMDGGPLSL